MGRHFMRLLEMHEWLPRATFRVVRNLKDSGGNALYGESTWHPEERQCWIAIAPNTCDSMAETLVHELLHVMLEGHMPVCGEEFYDEAYELALNRNARALWKSWKEQ